MAGWGAPIRLPRRRFPWNSGAGLAKARVVETRISEGRGLYSTVPGLSAYPNNPVTDASLRVGGRHGDATLRLFG